MNIDDFDAVARLFEHRRSLLNSLSQAKELRSRDLPRGVTGSVRVDHVQLTVNASVRNVMLDEMAKELERSINVIENELEEYGVYQDDPKVEGT